MVDMFKLFHDGSQRLDVMLSRYAPDPPIYTVKMVVDNRRLHEWDPMPLNKVLNILDELRQLEHLRCVYIEVKGISVIAQAL